MNGLAENLQELLDRLPQFREGLLITIELVAGGAIGAFVLAFLLGLALTTPWVVLRFVARVVVEFFRGTSLLVQIFWFFYVLPLLGWEMDPLFCGIVALSLNYGAYGAEVVRGSIASVPRGQYEAVSALSLSPTRGMFKVIIPQAWALMIPSLSNLLVQLLKGTAIVYLITLNDLYFQIENLRKVTGTWFAYGVGLISYFVIALVLVAVMNALETHAKHKLGKGPSVRESWRSLFGLHKVEPVAGQVI